MMQHKGYTGIMEIDEEAGLLVGRVLGLRDVITFQGETVADARRAFEESVDDYLAFCATRGEEPEKPYSGKFVVRIPPALHRQLASVAEARGVSLNEAVTNAIALHVRVPDGERSELAEPRADTKRLQRVSGPKSPAGRASGKGRDPQSPKDRPTTKSAGPGKAK